MIDLVLNQWSQLQDWLFETLVLPVAFGLGYGNLLEEAYTGTGMFMVGVLEVLIMLVLIAPLQHWRPVEPVTDKQAVRVDVVYTLIHKLGLFNLFMFFTFGNWLEQGIGYLRGQGMPTFHIDHIWPGVTDLAFVSFLMYLVVFDFVNYLIHRGQHEFEWWWKLHALHHSQRQMSMWTDNRNHLIDSIIVALILSTVAVLIGVGPGQFVALIAFGRLSENFQHANLRLSFGPVLERLWVSPRFHRRHHSIGDGHESFEHGRVVLGGCNFGVLLPVWDILFNTADFQMRFDATGVRDQVEQGRDYGRGFWAQQKQGVLRLLGRA
jgi:sterol desaturase/sphingolipid hydroxylase (fatty acid hydroxylase superfamily)